MELLKERIRRDGVIKEGNVLKVDSFLNHQMDIELLNEIGKEFKRLFSDRPINKILTIEASGIGIACIAAQYFNAPVVFAKKQQSINIDGEVYSTKIESFTHKKVYDVIVSKKFLHKEDHILIIDDFLANGCAMEGLIDLVQSSGAIIEGIGIVIEKGFQKGGELIRSKGVRVESLAIVDGLDAQTGEVIFRNKSEEVMKLVIQRVNYGRVTVDEHVIGQIGRGYVVLLGVGEGDTKAMCEKYVEKLVKLRIFPDENGKTNLSITDVGGEILVISQFTLYADCRKGNRPSFTGSGDPALAESLYDYFVELCRNKMGTVQHGQFGADMKIALENDGPFTILWDSRDW